MNLCVALIMLSIVFLVGVERTRQTEKEVCQAVAFLLQYSFLSVFSWSAIEGFHSTRGLVFPMKTDITSFVTKSLPIGWGELMFLITDGFISDIFIWEHVQSGAINSLIIFLSGIFLSLTFFSFQNAELRI